MIDPDTGKKRGRPPRAHEGPDEKKGRRPAAATPGDSDNKAARRVIAGHRAWLIEGYLRPTSLQAGVAYRGVFRGPHCLAFLAGPGGFWMVVPRARSRKLVRRAADAWLAPGTAIVITLADEAATGGECGTMRHLKKGRGHLAGPGEGLGVGGEVAGDAGGEREGVVRDDTLCPRGPRQRLRPQQLPEARLDQEAGGEGRTEHRLGRAADWPGPRPDRAERTRAKRAPAKGPREGEEAAMSSVRHARPSEAGGKGQG